MTLLRKASGVILWGIGFQWIFACGQGSQGHFWAAQTLAVLIAVPLLQLADWMISGRTRRAAL